ncbi:MAG: FkbM family methyltransferase [Bacteroidales bacterium]|jgi:FkbM family methyltransferase|nr:FkbM family methyltransferase [Bacteroidales bacterium]
MGQYYQDIIAYIFFEAKKNGFYVDIGANDGKFISNTYCFEKLGWEGVCIEPQPDIFEELKKNRTCEIYNAVIFSELKNEARFARVKGSIGLGARSGLDISMSDSHKKQSKELGGKIDYINVKTMTFDELMQNNPTRRHIDLL